MQQLMQDDADGPDIALRRAEGQLGALPPLGGVGLADGAGGGEVEVAEDEARARAVVREEDVHGFDVPVDDGLPVPGLARVRDRLVAVVDVGQRVHHLDEDVHHGGAVERGAHAREVGDVFVQVAARAVA